MQRLTIAFPPELLQRTKALAGERGISMATVIREAIVEKIAAIEGNGPPTPTP